MNEISNTEPLVAGIKQIEVVTSSARSDYPSMSLQSFNPKIKEATNIIPFKT